MLHEVSEPQLELFEAAKPPAVDLTSTFADNLSIPVHSWFRYTAGFSAPWVRELIATRGAQNVLDPFAGSGTVMLESEFAGVNSIGIEAHPYVFRIAKSKLNWRVDPSSFLDSASTLLENAMSWRIVEREYPDLIRKCYPTNTILKLEALKKAWQDSNTQVEIKELTWLVITSILRATSPVGTAQWQYILPNKLKGNVLDPFVAFKAKMGSMAKDMRIMQRRHQDTPTAQVHMEDARVMESVPDGWADLVITSPPYANNYDYADATRLEMTFWGDVNDWGDLQSKVRKYLIRSCTQHVADLKDEADEMLNSDLLVPIRDEMSQVFKALAAIRFTRGGKKNYHLMVLAYFRDLALVIRQVRRTSRNGSSVCFVIGDSAPYGIYVPVDKWLGELALASGFKSFEFEKLRDRNTKWKNRKHRVPLQEGRLWING